MLGPKGKGENDNRLHNQIDGQRDEGSGDQLEGAALPSEPRTRQLPEHDRAGTDLDHRVQAKPRQGHRARAQRGRRDDHNTNHVPPES